MDPLYLPRRCGGHGLIGAEDCVSAEEIGLSNYVQKSEEPLLVAVRMRVSQVQRKMRLLSISKK